MPLLLFEDIGTEPLKIILDYLYLEDVGRLSCVCRHLRHDVESFWEQYTIPRLGLETSSLPVAPAMAALQRIGRWIAATRRPLGLENVKYVPRYRVKFVSRHRDYYDKLVPGCPLLPRTTIVDLWRTASDYAAQMEASLFALQQQQQHNNQRMPPCNVAIRRWTPEHHQGKVNFFVRLSTILPNDDNSRRRTNCTMPQQQRQQQQQQRQVWQGFAWLNRYTGTQSELAIPALDHPTLDLERLLTLAQDFASFPADDATSSSSTTTTTQHQQRTTMNIKQAMHHLRITLVALTGPSCCCGGGGCSLVFCTEYCTWGGVYQDGLPLQVQFSPHRLRHYAHDAIPSDLSKTSVQPTLYLSDKNKAADGPCRLWLRVCWM